MAGAAHVYPNATQLLADKKQQWATSGGGGAGTQDSLYVALIASTSPIYTWGTTPYGQTTMTQFLTGDGTHGALTEVGTGLGYTRELLTSVTFTTTGLVNTLSCATIAWTATSNFAATYAVFYDGVASSASDSTNELVTYWDFGGTVSVVAGGNFTLTINASGLVTYTSS